MKNSYLVLVILFITNGCSIFNESQNVILKEVSNLEKSKKAILFYKGGNASADNSLHLSIHNFEVKLKDTEPGNTLTMDSNYGEILLDTNAISMNWQGNDSLIIELNSKLRTFTKKNKVNEVEIIYKEK